MIRDEFRSLDLPLLSYNEKTLSYKYFFQEVEKVKKKFNYFSTCTDFILINEENPLKFYILLFSLWESDKKVIFPNRDFFEGYNYSFVKYILTFDKLVINKKYEPIIIDEEQYDTVLFSSGSTGTPKGIVHKKDSFFKNAESVKDKLEIENIVSITPLKAYLVSALSHFLVHLLTKSHLIFIDITNLTKIKEISTIYTNLSYVGSPMHIISMLPFIKNSSPTLFFSSGDIFYSSIIKEILNSYPQTSFFNVYGMAELGGRLFINKINKNSNMLKSIGTNINLIAIKTVNNEVYVKSKLLFKGYIKDNIYEKRSTEYFATGDKIVLVDDNYEFYGRTNDEIKVAGNKVSMKYIEQKVSSILSDSFTPIVVNERHELLGNILILILYCQNTQNRLSRFELISSLREGMETYEIPHKFYYIKNIPYTQTMKINRKEILKSLDNLEDIK